MLRSVNAPRQLLMAGGLSLAWPASYGRDQFDSIKRDHTNRSDNRTTDNRNPSSSEKPPPAQRGRV